jgi:hypothetical protein
MEKLNQEKLTILFNKAKEISDKYSYNDWSSGLASIADKRTHTIRFNKFYNTAIDMGFDMITTIPDCIKPNI